MAHRIPSNRSLDPGTQKLKKENLLLNLLQDEVDVPVSVAVFDHDRTGQVIVAVVPVVDSIGAVFEFAQPGRPICAYRRPGSRNCYFRVSKELARRT